MVDGISSFNNGIQSSQQRPSKQDMEKQLTSLGIPSDVIQQGPNAVKQYAEQNGITLPKPPKPPEMQNNTGSQSIFNQNQTSDNVNQQNEAGQAGQPPAELVSKLTSLGIPSDVVQQGPDAVKQYAEQNGITLPEPPQPPQGGMRTSTGSSSIFS